MPSVLQNIGASGAGTSIADYVSRERALRVEEQRQGLETEARVGSLNAQAELTENQLIQARKQQAAESERRPFQLLLDNTKIPEAKEYITNLANSMGFVASDGTISVKNAKVLQGWLSSDLHKPSLSAMKLNHAKKQYDLFKKASEDPEFAKKNNLKPGNEEFQAQFEAAKQGWITAQAYDSNYQKALEIQQEKLAAAERIKSAEKIAADKIASAERIAALKDTAKYADYKLTDLKLATWNKYFADPTKVTDQEKELIGVLVDPFLRTASSVVLSDLGNMALSDDKKLEKILSMSKIFKQESSGKVANLKDPYTKINPMYTDENLKFTAEQMGITVEEVLKQLQNKNAN